MHRVHYSHLLPKSSRLPRQQPAGPSRLIASIPEGSDPSYHMLRVISTKVRSASYKQKTKTGGALFFLCAPEIRRDNAIPEKVKRTVHPHLSSCLRALDSPNLDCSRPVTADDSTPEW